jgi:hypothetical protein
MRLEKHPHEVGSMKRAGELPLRGRQPFLWMVDQFLLHNLPSDVDLPKLYNRKYIVDETREWERGVGV